MYCKVMTVALLLLVLFVVVNIVEAYDFAIHTDAHPWPKADAEKEIEKLVNAIKNKVNLEVFEPNQRDDLAMVT